MDFKLIIFLTGICLLVGYCQGAETPLDTETSTTNLSTEPTTTEKITTTPETASSSSTTTTTTNSSTSTSSTTTSTIPTPTTSSATTPTPNTTVTTPPQSKTWVVVDKTTNETCIVPQIISQFNFTYPVEIKANANITARNTLVIVPPDNGTEAAGLCTNTAQTITLKCKENSVEIDFKLGEEINFSVNLITLNSTAVDQSNCSDKETVLTYKNDATLFKTQVDVSYKCDKVQVVNMTAVSGNSSAILSITHTKFQDSREKKDYVSSPGLRLWPTPYGTDVESNLLRVNFVNISTTLHWSNQVMKFLEEYQNRPRSENVEDCNYERPPQPGKVCNFNLRELSSCSTFDDNKYFFIKGAPCIFLTLNQVYGWKPTMYNDTTKLPDKMPEELKDRIKSIKHESTNAFNTVWVTCEGENETDVRNLGRVNYHPKHGFPGYFFPYLNQEGYLSPIVAVRFERPATRVRINIVCKAWAHNIDNDRLESTGSVHFGLLIETRHGG